MTRALLLLLTLLLAPLTGRASESAPVTSPRATVTLLADRAAIVPGEPFRLMLHQSLAPGWHTYWRNAGDAGAPPEITLEWPPGEQDQGWQAGELEFPAPGRIPFGPLMNFGYKGEASFLLTVTPPASVRPGDYVTLTADATWLVCAEVCIPEEGRFTIGLDVAAHVTPAHSARFMAAEAALPRAAPFEARFAFAGPRGLLTIRSPSFSAASVREANFFPDAQSVVENAPEQRLTLREGEITLDLMRGPAEPPARLAGVLTLTDAAGVRGAYVIDAAPGGPAPGSPLGLWQILLFAALGGLILNLMPCVFPVLAMKAMAMAKLGSVARGAIRAEAASYTAGVVLAFLALGGLMLGLRAAGGGAGWGFQFTYPAFVAGMAWLMLAVGLNLSGVFQIGGSMGAGQGLTGQGGHAGSFFTGVLAVVVATPCTAPFMATAIGAALVLPAYATLAIFGAMGLGLALPYALLGVFPGAGRFLPRPGAWMERLRQFLAFPMYAAAAWLVWVLAQQSGPDGVLTALVGAVLIALAAWAWGVAQQSGRTPRRLGEALALAAVMAALALLPMLGAAPPASAAISQGEAWSAPRLAELRAEGRPVFVNLTAAWCISCKVNERVAIHTEGVQSAFTAAGVAQLTGDWTRGDAAITALLREHGRDGVPLYLLYPAGRGAPTILPQILTEGILLSALRASASSAQ